MDLRDRDPNRTGLLRHALRLVARLATLVGHLGVPAARHRRSGGLLVASQSGSRRRRRSGGCLRLEVGVQPRVARRREIRVQTGVRRRLVRPTRGSRRGRRSGGVLVGGRGARRCGDGQGSAPNSRQTKDASHGAGGREVFDGADGAHHLWCLSNVFPGVVIRLDRKAMATVNAWASGERCV